jgi:exodeoxyribonuclease-3
MSLKIISWNVNGIRACETKGLSQFIRNENPDIVCLQEVKAQEIQCVQIMHAFEGYEAVWHPAERPGYSGVLTMYRQKPGEVNLGMGEVKFDSEGRVLWSAHNDFFLVNLYFPNGGSGELRHRYKMEFLEKILDFFKRLDRKKPVIMTGDFNIAHKAVDIHDPVRLDGTSGFMPEERSWMDSLIDSGFRDTYRYLHPEEKEKYSWWSYRQESRRRNKGWRIDYFFISERAKDRVERSELHPEVQGSDHCPLSLVIR